MATVYLTFDDGPTVGTDDVIATLESQQVPGTFFMVGDHASGTFRREQLKAIHNSRFAEAGNHSSSHANNDFKKFYSNPQGVLNDFLKANTTLQLTGDPHIPARFPGRNTWRLDSLCSIDNDNGYDSSAAAEMLYRADFRIYGWDVEWKMDKGEAYDSVMWVFTKIKTFLKFQCSKGFNEVVLLTHDGMFKNSTGGRFKLGHLIYALKHDGHTFDFISNFRPRRKRTWPPPRA
jgi:peptidoglycan/xylan/chitin deacetylase (PgdA/CDA1 family)